MIDKKIAIIAIAVAAIIAVAAVSMAQNGANSRTDDRETYTFTDANDIEHTVKVPIENVSIVHKYIPVFMKILGKEDLVGGLDNKYGVRFESLFPNSFDIGSYSVPDGETMLEHGSKIVLTPVTMGLSNSDALRQMGIEVIYLDLTDPYEIKENLLILAKLVGGGDDVMARYDSYVSIFDECFDYAHSFDLSSCSDDIFGLFMASSGFYQTHASSAVKVAEGVSGRCYTHLKNPDERDTVYFNQDKEVLIDVDEEYGLDYMFVYSCDTPQENFDRFFAYSGMLDYSNLTCVKNDRLFALSTDMVNGALSCISAILYAKAFGADVGTAPEDMVTRINTEFGLNYSTADLLVEHSGI